jgi:NAD(P)-dependent dehydrogenase (short-subunit alcohol dehydrogenase family)/acyl carrier protein
MMPAPIVSQTQPVIAPAVSANGHHAVPKATPAPAAVSVADTRTQDVLLSVVAEKTGYPVEMLELDMSLDTDLGIDSIKRVEILSALQTQLPEAPVVKPEDLGRLQTLRQIVTFLGQSASPAATAPVPQTPKAPKVASTNTQVQKVLLDVVAEKTGYPVEMLELDMSLDTDLGIDSIKRVEILSALQTQLPEAPVVKPEDLGRLQTLRQIVIFVENGVSGTVQPVPAPPSPAPPIKKPAYNGHHVDEILDRQVLTVVPISGHDDRQKLQLPNKASIWVTNDGSGLSQKIVSALQKRHLDATLVSLSAALDATPLAGLIIVAPDHAPRTFIQEAFALMQRVGPRLRESGKNADAFLVSVSCLDGSFGLNGHTPRNPLTGGLAGLVKTASHEWPELACKSLDLSHDLHDSPTIADQIADEVLLKGPVEVGISSAGRVETRLVRKALNGEAGQLPLTSRDVIVVTGGARGVTAAVSIAIAKSYGCKLLLLGRSPEPAAEQPWVAGLTGEAAIKKAIAAHLKGDAKPRIIEEHYRRITADREVRSTLEQICSAGATVLYRSLDIRDAAATQAAVAEARTTLGPITGIIHGAGVLQDRLIEDKTSEQFEAVFSTKVDGFHALLQAVAQDNLKVIVAFSSTTGRFGRKGQIAYAAANEVLNKLAQREAHQRPCCRVLSMNWGPWEGGMVTPQLRRVFENEGVGLIPLQAGAEYLVREMSTPAGGPVEILILGPEPKANGNGHSPKHAINLVTAFERTIDVQSHPILQSHVMKGKAVVPTALIIEWLAHGAMHENPGLLFHGFDDLRILKGMTLKQKDSLTIAVLAGPATSCDGVDIVPVELRSGHILHARASILLTTQLPTRQASAAPVADQPYSAGTKIYADSRLFHGDDLQAIQSVQGWSDEGIIGQGLAAPTPAAWMKHPLRSGWLADPLALDAAFQLMILWSFESRGVGSLPTGAARYRQFTRTFPQSGTRIQIRVTGANEHTAKATIEFLDAAGKMVARMEEYECVMDATLQEAFACNQLAE